MTSHTAIAATGLPPSIIEALEDFDDLTVDSQHRFMQLLIRKFRYADAEFDIALATAAGEIHRDEYAQDELYPIGRLTAEGAREHYLTAGACLATECYQRARMAGSAA